MSISSFTFEVVLIFSSYSLAYCDLFVSVAALTLRIFPRMKLYETTLDDVRYDHDMFIPQPKAGSKGVRVVLS